MFTFFFECKFYMLDPIYKQKLKSSFQKFIILIGEKEKNEIRKTQSFIKLISKSIEFDFSQLLFQAQLCNLP